jgi:chromosome segregation protein
VSAARSRAQHVERDWHSLEVARRELEVKRENLEERSQQELGLDMNWEYVDYRRMIEGGEVTRIDQAQTASQIDLFRDEIKKLGNVNLESIEEESQLEARNEDLIKQVADIDDATQKLTELIDKLNIASRDRFGEVFTTIQEHFAGQNGMFRKLFGGGRAEVRLMSLVKEVETPDGVRKVETGETDLLESGIEVIAKPPGKEPRSISQLSGGEKTLTAVALLLAIFQSKPSCFCILDEVDAALDEGNVARYCGVVREFTSHSHFIVITHNKKTMQNADRLYGITMQERGVSTRVSVKFEQVGKDGSINAKPDHIATMPEVAPVTETRPLDDAPEVAPRKSRNGLLKRALAEMREEAVPTQPTL